MPPEAWLMGALGVMSTVVGILWRDHLRADADDRKDRDDWKAMAITGGADLRRLTEAVEAVLAKRPRP